jgi:outer membrane protein TolC
MKKTFLILTATIISLGAVAQVKVNKELQGLITQSFSYFPKVKEVENNVTIASQKVTLTELNKYPDVFGDASYNFVQPKILVPFPVGPGGAIEDFQFAPIHNVNGAVNANYLLFDFGRLKANVERSKDDLQYAKHNVDNAKSQLAYQVANVYYNIVYFQKAISIQDSLLGYLKQNMTIAESKLRNGDALKIDLLNIQASIDEEQNRKTDFQNQLQKQLNLLEYTTGIKQSNGKSFDFDLALIDTAAALTTAEANNIDFILAKDRIKAAQTDASIAKLATKPAVNLHGTAGVKNGYLPAIGEMRFNYAAGVNFTVPIYTGGKIKQQVKIAETVVKQNELTVETLSNTYKKDIAQAYTDIQSNIDRIKNTEGQIQQTLEGLKLATIRFSNGIGTNLEITNASSNVSRAALTRLRYEYQLCVSKVELARLTGYQYW